VSVSDAAGEVLVKPIIETMTRGVRSAVQCRSQRRRSGLGGRKVGDEGERQGAGWERFKKT
jgi:hypothetical protein